MTRWAPDAALRLEQAAIELFEQQGYAATTVPQIAERAGLTTRTFFRHFVDKREVLFLRDREFPEVVANALAGLPDDLDPLSMVEQGLTAATAPLQQWRASILRRRALIRSESALHERELLKSANLSDAVAASLRSRDVPPREARLLAALSVIVFDEALEAWLDADPGADLAAVLSTTWQALRALSGGGAARIHP
ncbi:helix-turn-helix domain-containing protein [Microbacterium sp. P05]|uniref:TetR/AcrR family transcriptional regulator n=1 Tax=Microbacterium sp. P05 TaxID=3366948 RepID=UPI0037452D38